MNAQSLPALPPSIAEIVEEYEAKRGAIPAALAAFDQAVSALETACSIGGAYGGTLWDRSAPRPYEGTAKAILLQSAWKHIIERLNVRQIATAKDLSQLETALTNPPEVNVGTVWATFGRYLVNPRQHILRGVAECFADLDRSYRSHSKVKIGVEGLPKRIIISGAFGFYGGYRHGQLQNVLDAMATLHDQPRMTYREFSALEDAAKRGDDPEFLGVTVRGFQNGNAHLIFDRGAQRTINLALAEFYGDALADDAAPETQRAESTAVSANLAYYPTPPDLASRVASSVSWGDGAHILEPSCGCGRLMDALRQSRYRIRVTGVEFDHGRAEEARAKGHHVQTANFLQVAPQEIFDGVVMNPPFSGRNYAKHIRHALRFLKPGGHLVAVLPLTAWEDHGELPAGGSWDDHPIASFAEVGTNISTGTWTYRKPA